MSVLFILPVRPPSYSGMHPYRSPQRRMDLGTCPKEIELLHPISLNAGGGEERLMREVGEWDST